jgi:hypothetical protein
MLRVLCSPEKMLHFAPLCETVFCVGACRGVGDVGKRQPGWTTPFGVQSRLASDAPEFAVRPCRRRGECAVATGMARWACRV